MSNKPRCHTCQHPTGPRVAQAHRGAHKNPDGSITPGAGSPAKKPCGCDCHHRARGVV